MPRASTTRTRATRPDRLAGALERCVGDIERFRREHWGIAPLHRRSAEDLADLLTLDDVDRIVASGTRRPQIRLVDDGQRVDPARYCTAVRLGGQRVADVVDPARLTACFADGATVVFQSLHRTVPSVGRFLAALEEELSHPVQANAYLTPAGAAGLTPHADSHDVIVVQLHGSKSWDVDGLGPVVLEPGHTVYLPAGTEHSAATQDGSSLHLTIGVLRVTYRDVLHRALRDLAGPLDRPLPIGYARQGPSGELESGVRELLDHVVAALGATDECAVAQHERHRRRPRLRHEGHLSSVARLPDVGPDTTVRLRPGAPPRIRIDSGRVRLDAGDRTIDLPVGGRAALEHLLTGEARRVAELPDLDAHSRLVVARRLVREGVLVLVT